MVYSHLQYLIQKKIWRPVNNPRVWFDQSETQFHTVYTSINKQILCTKLSLNLPTQMFINPSLYDPNTPNKYFLELNELLLILRKFIP